MQLKISLEQIMMYSKCPRQLGYHIAAKIPVHNTISSKDRIIIKELIKQAYINRTKNNYNPQWETIKARVNKAYFEKVDVSNKEQFKKVYESSIKCLSILNDWYYKYFLLDDRTGIVNVPLNIDVSKSIVTGVIDIVLIDPKYG